MKKPIILLLILALPASVISLPGQNEVNIPSVSKTLKPGELYSKDKIVGNMCYVPATGPEGFVQGSPTTEAGHWREAQFTHILTKNIAVMETEVTRQMWADLTKAAVGPRIPSCENPAYNKIINP